jgi:hypothetical protein
LWSCTSCFETIILHYQLLQIYLYMFHYHHNNHTSTFSYLTSKLNYHQI